MATSYRAQSVPVELLSADLRHDLASLYLAYYDGCDQHQFLSDFDSKDEVILVFNEEKIIGFSTYAQYRINWGGNDLRIIYSGDTIVHHAHWGQQVLAFTWIGRMGEIWREAPEIPLYWFLIVKGHRTYKYLPAFAKSFYPHWSEPRQDLAHLASMLARGKFGHDFNPDTGIIEFPQSRGHLKQQYALPTAEEMKKEAVRFFVERNPGYASGHEMVCLCEISLENMKPMTRRIFTKGRA